MGYLVCIGIGLFLGYIWAVAYLDRFYNSENEVGVSDSTNEHGGLPHVRKSECEAKETDDSSGESEQITLGNRIDSETICQSYLSPKMDGVCVNCGNDILWHHQKWTNRKES